MNRICKVGSKISTKHIKPIAESNTKNKIYQIQANEKRDGLINFFLLQMP